MKDVQGKCGGKFPSMVPLIAIGVHYLREGIDFPLLRLDVSDKAAVSLISTLDPWRLLRKKDYKIKMVINKQIEAYSLFVLFLMTLTV